MSILISILSVLFLVLCVLLIIIILLQSDKSAGMGIIGGSSQSAFGSSTADVITKATAIMVTLFMLGSFGLAMLESKRQTSLEKKISEKSGKTPRGHLEKGKEKGSAAPESSAPANANKKAPL